MANFRIDTDELNQRAGTMKAWIKRQEFSKKQWNADTLWNRIKQNWPQATYTEMEYIYQQCWPTKSQNRMVLDKAKVKNRA